MDFVDDEGRDGAGSSARDGGFFIGTALNLNLVRKVAQIACRLELGPRLRLLTPWHIMWVCCTDG
jgi:hypothetical protein